MPEGRIEAHLPLRHSPGEPIGDFWPAFDIFQWMDWHLPEAVMDRARRGLAEDIGPEQLAGLERRRRELQYIEIYLARDPSAGDPSGLDLNSEPAESLVTVHRWGPAHGHVRTFVDVLGLGHDRTAVQVIDLTTKRSQWATGDEYVTGLPLVEAPDIRGWLVARGDLQPSSDPPGASDTPSPG